MLDWRRMVDNLLLSCTKRGVNVVMDPLLFPIAHPLYCDQSIYFSRVSRKVLVFIGLAM